MFRTIADADPSLAQIPQSHYTFLEALRSQGTAAQREFFYSLVAGGALFADAQTHTLYDATRWKLQHIGRHALSGTRPPRHGQM